MHLQITHGRLAPPGNIASHTQLTRIRGAVDAGEAVEHVQAVGQGRDLVLHARDGIRNRRQKISREDAEVRYRQRRDACVSGSPCGAPCECWMRIS